ncbi:MAG: hypothetical protein WBM44_04930, partial [Waterburya sp.]
GLEGVFTPTQLYFFLKEEVLNQRDKLEVDLPSALCPLPSALRAKPDKFFAPCLLCFPHFPCPNKKTKLHHCFY